MTKSATGGHPDLKMVNPAAAAIDIGSTMHMAAVNPDACDMADRAGNEVISEHTVSSWRYAPRAVERSGKPGCISPIRDITLNFMLVSIPLPRSAPARTASEKDKSARSDRWLAPIPNQRSAATGACSMPRPHPATVPLSRSV